MKENATRLGMTILATTAAAGFNSGNAAAQSDPSRPNILCVVCEDISPYLGCYGDEVALDALLSAVHMNEGTCS